MIGLAACDVQHSGSACPTCLSQKWNITPNVSKMGHGDDVCGQRPVWKMYNICKGMGIMLQLLLVDREPTALVPRGNVGHNLLMLFRCY